MKERILEMLRNKCSSRLELADLLGVSYQSISNKMNGRSDFTRAELESIKNFYHLTPDELCYVFFSSENDVYAGESVKSVLDGFLSGGVDAE